MDYNNPLHSTCSCNSVRLGLAVAAGTVQSRSWALDDVGVRVEAAWPRLV